MVDRYEASPYIRNEDVAEFEPGRRYRFIVSISTIEHVGWDEEPRDNSKPRRAMANLHRLLAPGGRMLVTLPLGYNPVIDRMLFCGDLGFEATHYLKRVDAANHWEEVARPEVEASQYGHPFPWANALAVGCVG